MSDYLYVNTPEEEPSIERPAWLDAPVTIPLHEYVRLRVLEAQIGSEAACKKIREESDMYMHALAKLRKEYLEEQAKRENKEVEIKGLKEYIDQLEKGIELLEGEKL